MRILAIDGGGIRGIIPAYLLMKLEEQVGHPLREMVDLVGGTSTGAIIAASVATGKGMKEVYQLYKEQGEKVFQKKSALGIWKPFYYNNRLKEVLKKEFGEIALKELSFPLLIPTVDITKGKIQVFRSAYYNGEDEQNMKLWDAVLSSCSAPIYFPPNVRQHYYLTADGGFWANNPSLLCLTEGISQFKKTIEQIKIISIGTGKQKIHYSYEEGRNSWGLSKWFSIHFVPFRIKPTLLDLALQLSSESISYHCQILSGKNFLRIDQELGEEIPIDAVNSLDHLVHLAREMYENHYQEISHFLDVR